MDSENAQPEFWEKSFIEKQEMWGFEPAKSALLAKDIFADKGVKNVLIPGIGYGRNAQIFIENGMEVTGIEISQTAINMAKKHFGESMKIFHGSVTEIPFDDRKYDGIFCYALIHLLDSEERQKLLRDCYHQLSENGYMIFSAISRTAQTFGQGKFISKNRYELFGGVNMYFYDRESIEAEFGQFGMMEIKNIEENYPFFLIICSRNTNSKTNYENLAG